MASDDTHKLFVRNLPYTTTNEDLEHLFEEDGPLKKCFVVGNRDTPGKCKGFGFVTFALKEDVDKALASPKQYKGRELQLSLARRKEPDAPRGGVKRKLHEAADAFRKADLKYVDKTGDGKLRDATHSARIDDVRGKQKRSKPQTGDSPGKKMKFEDCEDDDMDGDVGSEDDIKDKDVKFEDGDASDEDDDDEGDDDEGDEDDDDEDDEEQEEHEEKNKAVPASTEKALREKKTGKTGPSNAGIKLKDKGDKEQPMAKTRTAVSDDGRTLFVKNLPFAHGNKEVTNFFSRFGPVESCNIFENSYTKLYKGMGFVTFSTKEVATECMQAANNKENPLLVDDRRIYISMAWSREDLNTNKIIKAQKLKVLEAKKALPKTQIMLKNVEYKLTEKDLRSSFEKFGTIVTMDTPVRRSIAFIGYSKHEEAASAIKHMNAKTLGGRTLTVEFRKTGLERKLDKLVEKVTRDKEKTAGKLLEKAGKDKKMKKLEEDDDDDDDDDSDGEDGKENDEDAEAEDSNDEMGNDDDDNQDESEEDGEDEEEEEPQKKDPSIDVKEERTIFVR